MIIKNCITCKYDPLTLPKRKRLCLHPDEGTPEFWKQDLDSCFTPMTPEEAEEIINKLCAEQPMSASYIIRTQALLQYIPTEQRQEYWKMIEGTKDENQAI